MLEKIFGANYRTTVAGLIGAIASSLIPILQGQALTVRDIGMSVALALLGYVAKATNVTGAGKDAVNIIKAEKEQDEINNQ